MYDNLSGMWDLVSWTRVCLEDKAVTYPFGEKPTGYVEFEQNRIYTIAKKDMKTYHLVPKIDDFLSKQNIKEFSYAGKYSIDNHQLRIKYEECSDVNKVGQERSVNFWYDGQATLILSAKEPILINHKNYIPSATFIKKYQ